MHVGTRLVELEILMHLLFQRFLCRHQHEICIDCIQRFASKKPIWSFAATVDNARNKENAKENVCCL